MPVCGSAPFPGNTGGKWTTLESWAISHGKGDPIMRRLLLLAMALLPGVAPAEVLNYDYVYLSVNGTENDPGSKGGDGAAGGGFKSFGKRTHVFLSYDNTAQYAGSNPTWDYNLKTWRIGAGGHYLIGKRTMIAPSLSVFRSNGEVMVPNSTSPQRLAGNGYIVQLDLRHALNAKLELTAAARRSKFVDGESTEFVAGVLFHPSRKWAVGVLYHDRERKRSTEFTVRHYY